MDEKQLIRHIKKIGISRDQILREEAEMEMLSALAKDKLSSKLAFYGGTALRLAYGSPRFSEDIDLIVFKKTKFSEFKKLIEKIIKMYPGWKITDAKNKKKTMFALINIKDEKLKHPFNIKIEIHKPAKKLELKTELLLVKSPVSIREPLLLVPPLQELKKLKTDALAKRNKARDIFDLWYISQVLRENFVLAGDLPKFSEREFRNELQVFLPRNYYITIEKLYAKLKESNK